MGNKQLKALGLSHGHSKTKGQRAQREDQQDQRPRKLPPDILTDDEVNHIQATWPHLRPNVNKILNHAFLDLFEESPDIKDKFMEFRNYSVADLKRVEKGKENALQRHVPRVGRAIVKIVNHVDNLDDVLDYIECVGKIHHKNGIMYHEMAALGPYFVQNSVRYLPSKHNKPEVLESWRRFFLVLTDLLRRGYPNVEVELTDDEKILIRDTFRLIRENMTDVGVSLFVGLFQKHSTSKMFFPVFKDSPLEDLTLSEALQNHGIKLMKIIETVVMELDSPTRQTDIFLARLGKMHQNMGIEKNYLDVMGPIFCQCIRPILVEDGFWDMEIRHAWLHLFRIVVLKIKKGYGEFQESFTGQVVIEGDTGSLNNTSFRTSASERPQTHVRHHKSNSFRTTVSAPGYGTGKQNHSGGPYGNSLMPCSSGCEEAEEELDVKVASVSQNGSIEDVHQEHLLHEQRNIPIIN